MVVTFVACRVMLWQSALRLKYLHQKEKAVKSVQAHMSGTITDVVTDADVSELSS